MTEIEKEVQRRCDAVIEEAKNDPEILNPEIKESTGFVRFLEKLFKA